MRTNVGSRITDHDSRRSGLELANEGLDSAQQHLHRNRGEDQTHQPLEGPQAALAGKLRDALGEHHETVGAARTEQPAVPEVLRNRLAVVPAHHETSRQPAKRQARQDVVARMVRVDHVVAPAFEQCAQAPHLLAVPQRYIALVPRQPENGFHTLLARALHERARVLLRRQRKCRLDPVTARAIAAGGMASYNGYIWFGTLITVGIPALATGWAQSRIGPAAAATLAEKPELTVTVVLLIAIPETVAILGFVIAVLILMQGGG